jgi:hypothetical protein
VKGAGVRCRQTDKQLGKSYTLLLRIGTTGNTASLSVAGLPHAGLISGSVRRVRDQRHRLPSDSASRRTPLPSLAVPITMARRGLSPPTFTTCLAHNNANGACPSIGPAVRLTMQLSPQQGKNPPNAIATNPIGDLAIGLLVDQHGPQTRDSTSGVTGRTYCLASIKIQGKTQPQLWL